MQTRSLLKIKCMEGRTKMKKVIRTNLILLVAFSMLMMLMPALAAEEESEYDRQVEAEERAGSINVSGMLEGVGLGYVFIGQGTNNATDGDDTSLLGVSNGWGYDCVWELTEPVVASSMLYSAAHGGWAAYHPNAISYISVQIKTLAGDKITLHTFGKMDDEDQGVYRFDIPADCGAITKVMVRRLSQEEALAVDPEADVSASGAVVISDFSLFAQPERQLSEVGAAAVKKDPSAVSGKFFGDEYTGDKAFDDIANTFAYWFYQEGVPMVVDLGREMEISRIELVTRGYGGGQFSKGWTSALSKHQAHKPGRI